MGRRCVQETVEARKPNTILAFVLGSALRRVRRVADHTLTFCLALRPWFGDALLAWDIFVVENR